MRPVIKLRSIPPANRTPGSLARAARKGKPHRTPSQSTSTSFNHQVVLPDPRIQGARKALHEAIRRHIIDLENLVQGAATSGEAEYWQGLLRRMNQESEK